MDELLRRSQFIVGGVRAFRGLGKDARTMSWILSRQRAIRQYLKQADPKGLQVGTGTAPLPGWLNTDIDASTPGVTYLDATRPFPIPDDSFDYVFSEHMIEHIDFDDAASMLRECHRILRPGGRIRVATPDLDVLLSLHGNGRSTMQDHYIRWIVEHCLPDRGYGEDVFVINNAFRAWGHRFLFDRDTLKQLMSECGFVGITPYRPGVSDDPYLQGLESHGREIGDESINQFETQVWEAVAPTTAH